MPNVTVPELLARNKQWAQDAKHVSLPFISERKEEPAHIIVIACFDPRSHPESFLQVAPATREIISLRNAGGHPRFIVPDILSIDHLNRVDDIMIIHHTDCGLTHVTTEQVKADLTKRGVADELVEGVDIKEFKNGLEASIIEDVQWLRQNPLLRDETNITGYVYDIKTGLLKLVI